MAFWNLIINQKSALNQDPDGDYDFSDLVNYQDIMFHRAIAHDTEPYLFLFFSARVSLITFRIFLWGKGRSCNVAGQLEGVNHKPSVRVAVETA